MLLDAVPFLLQCAFLTLLCLTHEFWPRWSLWLIGSFIRCSCFGYGPTDMTKYHSTYKLMVVFGELPRSLIQISYLVKTNPMYSAFTLPFIYSHDIDSSSPPNVRLGRLGLFRTGFAGQFTSLNLSTSSISINHHLTHPILVVSLTVDLFLLSLRTTHSPIHSHTSHHPTLPRLSTQ